MDYERFREKAKGFAKKRGHESEADDFAQEATIIAFTRKSFDLKLEWLFADYLRRTYGRTGPYGDNERKHLFSRPLSLDAPMDSTGETDSSLHDYLTDTRDTPEHHLLNAERRYIHETSDRQKQIIEQTILGFSAKEIAKKQNVSESRIFQELKEIKEFNWAIQFIKNTAVKDWVKTCYQKRSKR